MSMSATATKKTRARFDLPRAATLMQLASDLTRLRLLEAIEEECRNVGALCKLVGLPQPAVSHHLALLRVSGVVESERRGKEVFYELTPLGRDLIGKARDLGPLGEG